MPCWASQVTVYAPQPRVWEQWSPWHWERERMLRRGVNGYSLPRVCGSFTNRMWQKLWRPFLGCSPTNTFGACNSCVLRHLLLELGVHALMCFGWQPQLSFPASLSGHVSEWASRETQTPTFKHSQRRSRSSRTESLSLMATFWIPDSTVSIIQLLSFYAPNLYLGWFLVQK